MRISNFFLCISLCICALITQIHVDRRGQNGTACVLRALCETEKMHLNAHYREAPQSFVMELLRSIFALPKETLTNSKESLLPLDTRYTAAVLLAHDDTQSCSQQYFDCEYSITNGI